MAEVKKGKNINNCGLSLTYAKIKKADFKKVMEGIGFTEGDHEKAYADLQKRAKAEADRLNKKK